MIFYGRATSDNTQKARGILEETGQDYQHIEVGGRFGGLDNPEFLKLNPNGRVPALIDGEVSVAESDAIIRYLAASYCAETFWPEDPKQRAAVDQWMSWGHANLYPVFNKLFWSTVRAPKDKQNPEAIKALNNRLTGYFLILEERLSDRNFVMGDKISMADITTGMALYRYFLMPIERPALPAVERWYGRLKERDAYQRAVMVSFEALRGKLDF
jgi:glutathione S-transferase